MNRCPAQLRAMGALLALLALSAPFASGTVTAAAVGELAPDFALPAASGGNVRLSEHRGEVVLLTFWSSQCSVCITQIEALGELQATYRSAGLVTFGVSVDDDLRRARRFASAHTGRVPLLIDKGKGVSRDYRIEVLPTTVMIDRRGRVRYLQSDYHVTDKAYVAQVRALLDDPL